MADAKTLTAQLDKLERRIEDEVSKSKRSMTISVIVGIVLVVILIGYFSFMSSLVAEAAEPEGLAQMASVEINERIPEVSKQLEQTAKEQAPELVNAAINYVVDEQLPGARKAAEDTIKKEVEAALDKYEAEITTTVDETMDKHRENIKQLASQLTTAQGKADFEEELYRVITESLEQQDIKMQMEMYRMALMDINAMLGFMAEEEFAATQEQEALRNLIGILRELASRAELNYLGTN